MFWHALVQGHYAALNTDFHYGDPGILVKEGSGEFDGQIFIDMRQLANGWHRLRL